MCKITTEDFIKECKATHGDKYTYDRTIYTGVGSKVEVLCNECGNYFWQQAYIHRKGSGCPPCVRKERGRKQRMTTDEFISKAVAIHGDKYLFDQFEYTHNKKASNVYCTTCSVYFKQTPSALISGKGCKVCGIKRRSNKKRLGKEEFIRRSKLIHGNAFSYDRVVYTRNTIPVIIYCKEHNLYFNQTPGNHMRGAGCIKCGRRKTEDAKRLTTDDFIKRSRRLHGDKFTYNNCNVNGYKSIVDLFCNKHRERFKITVSAHLRGGHGCEKCKLESINKKKGLSTKEAIAELNKIHKNKYDYSLLLISPKSRRQKIKIICKTHGIFTQRLSDHLRGCGCVECHREETRERQKMSLEEFVSRSEKIHDGKYLYDKVIYKSGRDPVLIFCKKHKEYFKQKPAYHVTGRGCFKCGIEAAREKRHLGKEEVLRRANKVHGQTYKYKDFKYKNGSSELDIFCEKHNLWFRQKITLHLSGSGCPICSKTASKGERVIYNFFRHKKISVEAQKSFRGCRYKNKLRFDFYVEELNLLIEYQGRQHFGVCSNDFFGGKEKFEERKERDQIKRDFAAKKGINLLEIPYYEFSNIRRIISRKIKEIKKQKSQPAAVQLKLPI